MNITDVITAVSVAIAALAFMAGINAWRREFVGKRRIELAENVLALFYEAQDAIREIRSPFSDIGEGSSRKHSGPETEEETKILDQAYIVFERHQKREKLFAELRSVKYRVMATFGSEAGEPFEELNSILNEIFVAAYILGARYWRRQVHGEMSKEESKQMEKLEEVFWSSGQENDQVASRVQKAVEKIETIAKKEAAMSRSRWEQVSKAIIEWIDKNI